MDVSRKCFGCDKHFAIGPRERNKRKWCSNSCRSKYRFRTDPEYAARQSRAASERNKKRYVPTSYTLSCHWCNEPYTAKRPDQKFCTKPCQYLAHRHKRKALMRGASHTYYSHLSIAERDGWACGICGDEVNPDLVHPDPGSRSIDHVIPLSKGGVDAPHNVQLAHLDCNIAKGDQLDFTAVSSVKEMAIN